MGKQRFKVGDRVTNNETTRVDVEEHWNTYFRRSQGEIIDGALVVASVSDRASGSNIGLGNKVGHPLFYMPESTLKFAEPAALKIEAGKFYKTRDGRKAKVERARYGDSYDFVATFEGWSGEKVCKKDGKHGSRWIANNPSNDLVAEWIDEPVAKAKPSNDNANPKFKVGDRVKCLKSCPGQFTAGKEYVVSADHFGRKYESVKVNFDDAGSTENGWLPEFFELVTPTTAIVALIESGQPKPSSTPHVHTSTDSAEKEAKRLAAEYKGKQFGVFTLTTTHEKAAPVYDHKWQNMAALGLKIDAIKELRAVAGLTLKGAKDAVEAWIEYENAS
ncbi:hypothetical protein [Agrobacterium radiobacter]|uniref:hypothetical protein n=1 Tax=Agrobacterium radiobacter TaxID=362 RepID=UPI003CE44AC2